MRTKTSVALMLKRSSTIYAIYKVGEDYSPVSVPYTFSIYKLEQAYEEGLIFWHMTNSGFHKLLSHNGSTLILHKNVEMYL